MILVLPVIQDILEKARRSAKLVRKVRTVTRDGVAYQQAFWVLPSQAGLEDMPTGAQFDLFDQIPARPEPPKAPEPEPPLIHLSQQPRDNPDKVTTVFRKIAADMMAWTPPAPIVQYPIEAMTKEFRGKAAQYGASSNLVEHFLDGLSFHYADSWPTITAKLKTVVDGDRGVAMPNGITVKSKYHDLPFEDVVRLYAGWVGEGDEMRHKAWALYNELTDKHKGLYPAIVAIDNMKNAEREAVAAGRRSFQYKIGKKAMIFKAAQSASTADAEVTGTPEEQVKALVARGVKTPEDCIRIGEIIYKAAGGGENADLKRIEEIHDEAMAMYQQYKKKYAAVGKAANYKPGETAWEAEERYRKVDAEYTEWMKTVYNPKTDALTKEDAEIRKRIQENKLDADGKKFLDFIARIRPMGPAAIQFPMASYTGSTDPTVVRDAMSVFPTAWLEKLSGRRVEFKNVREGHGSAGRGIVRAPWTPGMKGHSKMTQAHEIGHEIERVAGLGELCRQFVYSLADDENNGRVKNQKGAMRNWQKGIQSPHLPDQYAGVLYDWGDTEVVSSAAGDFYENWKGNLSKGAKYWHFILGLWAGV